MRPTRHFSPLEWVGAATVLAAAARMLWLAIAYLFGRPSAARFQVESAATAFALVALLFGWIRSRKDISQFPESNHPPATTIVLWWMMALVLYSRALSTGFLSDDYVLIDRASRWSVGAVTSELFRPVPLALWAVMLHAGAGAVTLHLLNVMVHGTNAFLSTRVVQRLLAGQLLPALVGGLLLTFPLGTEAVVWCSGVFDVLATALVLGCVLASRGYDLAPTIGRRCGFFALGLAALLSKETAAVVGVLVLLDAWLRRSRNRALIVDAGMLVVAAAVFGAIRVAASDLIRRPLTKYALQRFLFGEFGSLAVPWHGDVIRSAPWLPVAGVLMLTGLMLRFALTRGGISRTRVVLSALMWVVAAGAPLATFFFVAPDLQGSRYLYLPSVGWAILLVAMAGQQSAENESRVAAFLALGAVVALIVTGSVGVRLHQQPWQHAAAVRNEIEAAAKQDVRMASCPIVQFADLPDSVEGAYVFRNGAAEAFGRDVGLNARVGRGGGPCAFEWDPARHAFVRGR
ncbi:MAG TPA: hypothetical protein VGY48_17020 [Vicinamibacterales bacterium]|nr:hypothetical protein [Vicinamibacterales bacterium]